MQFVFKRPFLILSMYSPKLTVDSPLMFENLGFIIIKNQPNKHQPTNQQQQQQPKPHTVKKNAYLDTKHTKMFSENTLFRQPIDRQTKIY